MHLSKMHFLYENFRLIIFVYIANTINIVYNENIVEAHLNKFKEKYLDNYIGGETYEKMSYWNNERN